ncbi:MAG: metallophosphoesterase [bacterium]|nr:metallophosphoesterase [bacterium]
MSSYTDLSRRGFLLEACGCAAAFGFGRAFAVPSGAASSGRPNLRFGLLSDVHISTPKGANGCETFLEALKYFRDRNADAVVIAGDLTNNSFIEELEVFAQAWYEVFPDDKLPDGRRIEKIFVGGNHEWEGWKYGRVGTKRYPDPEELKRHLTPEHYAEVWKRLFHEEFAHVYRKDVKGYTFLAAHWPWHISEAPAFIAREASGLDSAKPFFYVQHPHPKGTVYHVENGEPDGSADVGATAEALAKFPNAVAFSGHSHRSLTDEKSIWQGAFTSVATATLRNVGARSGYENSGPRRNSEFKQMPINVRGARQGQFVSVYDDRIVFERREFKTGQSLGDDWVVPLGTSERPYAFAKRASDERPAEFPPEAVVTVGEECDGQTRGKKPCRQIKLTFPAALPGNDVRGTALGYEVQVLQTQGDFVDLPLLTKRVFGPGYGYPVSDKPDDVELLLNATELPHECLLEFRATAIGSFGRRSKAITSGRTKLKGVVIRW